MYIYKSYLFNYKRYITLKLICLQKPEVREEYLAFLLEGLLISVNSLFSTNKILINCV